MIPLKEKISPFHLAMLVFMSQIGIGIFTLPRELADHYGTNGWLFLFVCLAISTFNIYLISLVFRLGRGRSLFEIFEKSISKVVLYPGYVVIASIWAVFGCVIAKKYILLFQMIAFPTTNPMGLKLAIDILAYFLLVKGIYNISKSATLFFWIAIWMWPLLLLFFPEFEWLRLTPFLLKGGHDMLKGGIDIYTSYMGYELSILLFPYIDQRKKPMLAIYSGNAFLTVIYVSLSLLCFGIFSFGQLKNLLFPLLDIQAMIHFPFIERLENLLYGFYLFLILITLVMYLWSAQEAVFRITRKAKSKVYIIIAFGLTYGISSIPKTLDQVNVWITYLGYAVTAIGFGLPIVAIFVLLLQRKGGELHA